MTGGSKATHTWDELTSGIPMPTGQHHTIVVPAQELIVRFEIDLAKQGEQGGERDTPIGGESKDVPTYQQTKTVSRPRPARTA